MNITISQEGMNPITISTESAADATGGGPVDAGTQQAVQQMQDTNASNLQQLQDERNSLIQQMQNAPESQRGMYEARIADLNNKINAITGTEMPKSAAGMPSNNGRGTPANYDSVVGQQAWNASDLQQLQDEKKSVIQQMQNAPESQRGMYEARIADLNNKINAISGPLPEENDSQAMQYAKKMGKQYVNTLSNTLNYKATGAISDALGKAGSEMWKGAKTGARGIKTAMGNTINNLKEKDWAGAKEQAGRVVTKAIGGIKGVGAAAASNAGALAAGATIAVAAAAVARFLGGTIFNAIASIGKFTSGNEMIASPKFQAKLNSVKAKYPAPYPSPQDVKSDPRAQSKVGFLSWLVGGGSAGKKIMDQVGSVGMLVKDVNGITVAISTMTPVNMQQLAGLKVMIATAFVNKNGQITSVPVARGFLASGSVVNASREAADIYFDNDGFCFKKEHIFEMARKTMESFGPISSIQSAIINEYCI